MSISQETQGGRPVKDTGHGSVIAVRGAVVDVSFDTQNLPPIDDALVILCEGMPPVVAEGRGAPERDNGSRTGVAVDRGTAARRAGSGQRRTGHGAGGRSGGGGGVLGRLLDVVGDMRDGGAPVAADVERRPIHRLAPPLAASAARPRCSPPASR